jgi:TetR/AcrR family transcriptional repressor of mexJK operon
MSRSSAQTIGTGDAPAGPRAEGSAPSPDKRALILAAARAVFMEVGYARASMDAITRRAGVSKATVYAYFPGKARLFVTMVGEECERRLRPGVPLDVSANQPEAGLIELGRRYADLLFSENALTLGRLVAAESARQPELAEAFYQAGPARALDTTARFFAEMAARGALAVPDPQIAAELFLGAIRNDLHLRRFIGLPIATAEPDAVAIDRRVREAARAFALAYRK